MTLNTALYFYKCTRVKGHLETAYSYSIGSIISRSVITLGPSVSAVRNTYIVLIYSLRLLT